jgi:uncharacterized protein
MSLFLIVFLSIYSALHLFVYFHARFLLPPAGYPRPLLLFFMAGMIFAPMAVRLLERGGHERLAQTAAWVGYPWMGFIFLSFTILIGLSILHLGAIGLRYAGMARLPALVGKGPAAAAFAAALVLSVYGFFEARSIRVERLRIETSKLPEGMAPIRIAQISDVHLGLLVRDGRLGKIVSKIRAEAPDLLVGTGDIVDGQMHHLNGISPLLSDLSPRLGKFAVVGNHEVYAGLSQSLSFLRTCGFTLLRQESLTVGGVINVVGVDDEAAGSRRKEAMLLASVQNGLFTLFLRHRPTVHAENLGRFDLQLSGHTHAGQIYPFRHLVALFYPRVAGFYPLPNGSSLYTSRGTGTWGPPMRLFSPPEITLIELVRPPGP